MVGLPNCSPKKAECIAHWFQWRDQNVGGRYDDESYDVGFFDVADIPNEDFIRAVEEYGRNLYNSIK